MCYWQTAARRAHTLKTAAPICCIVRIVCMLKSTYMHYLEISSSSLDISQCSQFNKGSFLPLLMRLHEVFLLFALVPGAKVGMMSTGLSYMRVDIMHDTYILYIIYIFVRILP